MDVDDELDSPRLLRQPLRERGEPPRERGFPFIDEGLLLTPPMPPAEEIKFVTAPIKPPFVVPALPAGPDTVGRQGSFPSESDRRSAEEAASAARGRDEGEVVEEKVAKSVGFVGFFLP